MTITELEAVQAKLAKRMVDDASPSEIPGLCESIAVLQREINTIRHMDWQTSQAVGSGQSVRGAVAHG